MQLDHYIVRRSYDTKDRILSIKKVQVNQINILIVDDCETASLLIKHQLQSLDVSQSNITCVNNAADALKAVKSRFYSFIILDYHLGNELTGVELLNLMLRSKLISHLTAVLMISGDARQETVATSLSGHVRHFLKKPLQTKALSHKIQLALQEQQQISDVERELYLFSHLTLQKVISLKSKYQNSICVESLIIDTLVKHNRLHLLKQFLPFCQHKDHASLVCAQAYLLKEEGSVFHAIQLLADYVARKPLCLRAMDNLAGLYESQRQLSNALLLADRAFSLTPSNSCRMLSVSRIASKLHKKEKLFEIGLTYAARLSPTDPNWLFAISCYVEFVSNLYGQLTNIKEKRELLTKLNHFCEIALGQLSQNQKADLSALKQIMQCNLLLKESRPEQAHQKLLLSISLYYKNLLACPAIILRLAIPLMEFFGEFELQSSLQFLLDYKQSEPEVEYITRCNNRGNGDGVSIEEFPFSIEAKLNYLVRQHSHSGVHDTTETLKSLTQLALPPNWFVWVKDFSLGSHAPQLPKPFNFDFS